MDRQSEVPITMVINFTEKKVVINYDSFPLDEERETRLVPLFIGILKLHWPRIHTRKFLLVPLFIDHKKTTRPLKKRYGA